jgi:hypothetical protein
MCVRLEEAAQLGQGCMPGRSHTGASLCVPSEEAQIQQELPATDGVCLNTVCRPQRWHAVLPPKNTRTAVLPCAPCPAHTHPQKELGLPVNKDIPLIAFIGRLDPQKGADILLGAAPSLLQYNNVQVGAHGYTACELSQQRQLPALLTTQSVCNSLCGQLVSRLCVCPPSCGAAAGVPGGWQQGPGGWAEVAGGAGAARGGLPLPPSTHTASGQAMAPQLAACPCVSPPKGD